MNFPLTNISLKFNPGERVSSYKKKMVKKLQELDFTSILAEDSTLLPASDTAKALGSANVEDLII